MVKKDLLTAAYITRRATRVATPTIGTTDRLDPLEELHDHSSQDFLRQTFPHFLRPRCPLEER